MTEVDRAAAAIDRSERLGISDFRSFCAASRNRADVDWGRQALAAGVYLGLRFFLRAISCKWPLRGALLLNRGARPRTRSSRPL
jgi:hypothetical protein